jgi:hypothetical protein
MLRAVLGVYMRLYHRLELHGAERLPSRGPAIILVNHASLLDVPALMVLDPYPNTVFIAKASLLKLPIAGWLLNQWGAIAVERQGRDSAGVRTLLTALRAGKVWRWRRRVVGRDGSTEPINPRCWISARSTPLVPGGDQWSFALPAFDAAAAQAGARGRAVPAGARNGAADGAAAIRRDRALSCLSRSSRLDDDPHVIQDRRQFERLSGLRGDVSQCARSAVERA